MFATRKNQEGPSRKTKPKWTGPYKVIKCDNDWDFTLEHLVTGKSFHAHSSRMKYYCDKDLDVTVDLKYQITHDEMRYKVEKILDYEFQDNEHKLLIQWQGFDKEESTWEPLEIIYEDVPTILSNYVKSLIKKGKTKEFLQEYINQQR